MLILQCVTCLLGVVASFSHFLSELTTAPPDWQAYATIGASPHAHTVEQAVAYSSGLYMVYGVVRAVQQRESKATIPIHFTQPLSRSRSSIPYSSRRILHFNTSTPSLSAIPPLPRSVPVRIPDPLPANESDALLASTTAPISLSSSTDLALRGSTDIAVLGPRDLALRGSTDIIIFEHRDLTCASVHVTAAYLALVYDAEELPRPIRSFEKRFDDFERTVISHFTQLGLPWLIILLYFICDKEVYEDEDCEKEAATSSERTEEPPRNAADWKKRYGSRAESNCSTSEQVRQTNITIDVSYYQPSLVAYDSEELGLRLAVALAPPSFWAEERADEDPPMVEKQVLVVTEEVDVKGVDVDELDVVSDVQGSEVPSSTVDSLFGTMAPQTEPSDDASIMLRKLQDLIASMTTSNARRRESTSEDRVPSRTAFTHPGVTNQRPSSCGGPAPKTKKKVHRAGRQHRFNMEWLRISEAVENLWQEW